VLDPGASRVAHRSRDHDEGVVIVILSLAKDLAVLAQMRVVLPPAVMPVLYTHIAAGMTAIVTGYVALFALKGGAIHKKIGLWFVFAMVAMGMLGAVVAMAEGKASSVNSGLTSAYFVVTAIMTVRPPTAATRRVTIVAMSVILIMSILGATAAIQTLAAGKRSLNGVPVAVLSAFAIIDFLCARSDWRVLREGIQGSRRIARHLWRMCFSLFIATGSFFIGQAHVIPKPIRMWSILLPLAFLPLAAMGYWIWRIRVRQQLRGLIVSSPAATAA